MRGQPVVPILTLLACLSAGAQAPADFSGHWGQQSGSPGTQRRLDIEENGPTLRVKTTVINSKGTRQLEVVYRIGGPPTVYKGLDGDKFRSSVKRDGDTLVFETVETEGGRKIPETTVWVLSDDRNSFQATRRSARSGGKAESVSTYARLP